MERIDQLLRENEHQLREQRFAARRIYQLIQEDEYSGGESVVQRYVRQRRKAIRGREA